MNRYEIFQNSIRIFQKTRCERELYLHDDGEDHGLALGFRVEILGDIVLDGGLHLKPVATRAAEADVNASERESGFPKVTQEVGTKTDTRSPGS